MSLREALDMARKHLNAGGFPKAAEIYLQVAKAVPNNFEVLHNLTIALMKLHRSKHALTYIDQAIQLKPDDAHGLHAKACVLTSLERFDEAIECFEKALEIDPDFVEGWCNLANAHIRQGKLDHASEAVDRAVELQPKNTGPLFTLATAHRGKRKYEEAEAVLRRVLEVKPNSAAALSNLGAALMEQDRLEEAMEALEKAKGIRPDLDGIYVNMGSTLVRMERYEDGVKQFEEAIKISPKQAAAHFNRGMVLLRWGQLAEGWKEYRWRWQWDEFNSVRLQRRTDRPPWDGRDMAGRNILIHFEQGLGDVIHFARYVKRVAEERNGKVVLEVQKPLERLMQRLEGVESVVAAGVNPGPIAAHAAVMDLPDVFGTTLENIPADVPYLSPFPEDVETWKERLGKHDRPRVGLVWGGSVQNTIDHLRSMPTEQLRPLLDVEGVNFYSLQVGRDGELAALDGKATDLSPHLNDFADTAAAIDQMDLIISVDTASLHLAGAMAKPVWLMLYHPGEWRWLENRDETPWYPTMRIFRQKEKKIWSDVIERISAELKNFVADWKPQE